MKKFFFAIPVIFLFVLASCAGGNSYKMEIFYSNNQTGGDTTFNSKTESISAASDSLAYLKATEKFNEMKSKADNDKMPVKFTLRNKDSMFVTNPADKLKGEKDLMYPNQRP